MFAVYVNCLAVIVGAIFGLLVGKKLSENFKEIVFTCSGLITMTMAIQMALQSSNYLALLISLLIGGAVGYGLKIEDRILSLGNKMEKLTMRKAKETQENESWNFGKGFLITSVLFCSGAMAVVGSIQAGTVGEYQTIFIKSVMDGCMAVVFASIYGPGVIFSSLFILVYQGFFTIGGSFLEPVLGEIGITELTAAGGILLFMIGFGLLKIKEYKTANFLPALVFAPILGIWANKIL
ncbi:MAG: DUF554 domain-containing protein [Sphaerochaetaceae bacterium]|nr:DUF554 domain-containing protein [Sphaerochaetaceae bacterium]